MNQLLFGSQEDQGRDGSKDLRPVRGHMCGLGLGEGGKKWTDEVG